MDDITNRRFERLETRIEDVRGSLDQKIEDVRVTLDQKIEDVRVSLDQKIEDVRVTLDQKIEDVRVSLERKMEGVRLDIGARVENVARGLEVAMNAGIAAGFAAAAEQRRDLHAETMRKFQQVIDDAERAGAMAARDSRMSVLEADVTELRGRLSRLEKVVGPGEPGPARPR